MKRFLITLALCAAASGAFAQAPVRQLRPDASAVFSNGNSLLVVSTNTTESFIEINSATLSQSFDQESVSASNERMQSIPGIRAFSRGAGGYCKLYVETARAAEILKNVVGFTDQEIAKIYQ